MFPNQANRIKEDCIREFADLTDERVMLEVQQGNGDAFAVLFDRYHRLVLVTALKILRDVGEAEEVTQNVFFEIYRAAGKFDPTRGNLKIIQGALDGGGGNEGGNEGSPASVTVGTS